MHRSVYLIDSVEAVYVWDCAVNNGSVFLLLQLQCRLYLLVSGRKSPKKHFFRCFLIAVWNALQIACSEKIRISIKWSIRSREQHPANVWNVDSMPILRLAWRIPSSSRKNYTQGHIPNINRQINISDICKALFSSSDRLFSTHLKFRIYFSRHAVWSVLSKNGVKGVFALFPPKDQRMSRYCIFAASKRINIIFAKNLAAILMYWKGRATAQFPHTTHQQILCLSAS